MVYISFYACILFKIQSTEFGRIVSATNYWYDI